MCAFISIPSHAEEQAEEHALEDAMMPPPFGLAMHGQTKYNADSAHLDYINPNAPKGGDLKIAGIGTFDSLNPYALKGLAPQNMNLAYDRLMRRVWDEPFTLYPLIAKSVDIPDDRSSITFNLNKAARFHDDSPITTADVQFSFNTFKEHGRPNMRRIYKLVTDVIVTDEQSITFKLGEGYDRETVMILAIMPVLSKSWWEGRDFNESVTEAPLLNGPYKITTIDMGHKITYERIPNYWAKDLFANKGHYNFNTITYEYFRDNTIALEAFKKGDLTLRREWDINKWRGAYNDMNADNIKNSFTHQRPERAHGFIFNLRRPPFDDIRVREALSLAFDSDWVAKNLFHGEFKRIESFYPNSILDGSGKISPETHAAMMAWKGNIKPTAYAEAFKTETNIPLRQRLRRAADLLKDAGWIIKDGKRVHSVTSVPLTFEILLSSEQEKKIALTYKRMLDRLGITLNIRVADSATFQDRKSEYDYDMIAFYWQNSLSPGTEQMLNWSCDAANKPSGFNFSGICNPALDHFSAQIPRAKTYDELIQSAHIIDRILLSEHASIPLFYKGKDYIAHHQKIHSPETVPTYGAVLETWWMEQKTAAPL